MYKITFKNGSIQKFKQCAKNTNGNLLFDGLLIDNKDIKVIEYENQFVAKVFIILALVIISTITIKLILHFIEKF